MRGIDVLRRQLETPGPDIARARRIENISEDLASTQQWLEVRLIDVDFDAQSDVLWIDCAHSFSKLAELALLDLQECHRELTELRAKARRSTRE